MAQEAAACGAELVIIGGDVRARDLVLGHLSEADRGRTVVTAHGSRAPASSERSWDAEAMSLIDHPRDAGHDKTIEAFKEGHRRGGAVDGLGDVTAALRAGQPFAEAFVVLLERLHVLPPDDPAEARA